MNIMKRFNRLTQDEFMLLKGTEKLAVMISNKFKTYNFDVVEWLEENFPELNTRERLNKLGEIK